MPRGMPELTRLRHACDVSGGPRDYGAGTERLLFRMARGTCYYPECPIPVVSIEASRAIVGVDIAHIRGAKPGSARFDPGMTDGERAAIDNLILLCKTHHKLVDTYEPKKYTVEMLAAWKRDNEPSEPPGSLGTVLTESNLERILEDYAAKSAPLRRIEVVISAGFIINEAEFMSVPLDQLIVVLELNPFLEKQPKVLVTDIRNVGSAAVSVASISIYWRFAGEGVDHPPEMALLGRNDFGASNPPLPYRLADGQGVQWLTSMDTIRSIGHEAHPLVVEALRAEVRLATGEVISSDSAAWPWREPDGAG
jgi:hypothetical protein